MIFLVKNSFHQRAQSHTPISKVILARLRELTPGFTVITQGSAHTTLLKYGSEEKGSSFCKCSTLMGFIMSKKPERLRSELLSEDKITNLLGFLT